MAALSGEKKAVKTNATSEHGTEFRTKIPVKTDGPICFENKVRNLTQTFSKRKHYSLGVMKIGWHPLLTPEF